MSVFERRLGCTGSAHAERGLPYRVPAAADRNRRIHEAATLALLENLAGELAWTEDDEGVEVIDAYVEVVRSTSARLGGTLLVESRFNLAHLHPELYGIADAIVVGQDTVAVIDLKTGRGPRVEVRRPDGGPNLQLGGYGLGGLTFVRDGQARNLELHVVQPLNGGHSYLTLSPAEVIDLGRDITAIFEASLATDAPRAAGEWCRWCRATATCPTLRQHIAEAADIDFDRLEEGPTVLVPVQEMSSEKLGRLLRAADMIETWIGAVKETAMKEARAGRPPEGYKLVERRGRRRWADVGKTQIATALAEFGVDAWRRDLIPAAMAVRAAQGFTRRTGQRVDLSDIITTTPPSAALVPDDDPRPAVASGPDVGSAD